MPKKLISAFTLLELMIALFLGSLLSISVIQLSGTLKKIFLHQEALIHIQETMQTTLFMMGEAIRGAGNMGEVKWTDAKTKIVSSDINLLHFGLDSEAFMRVTNKEALKKNPFVPKSVIRHIKPNTDVLWVVSTKPVTFMHNDKTIYVRSHYNEIEIFNSPIPRRDCRQLTSTLYYVSDTNNLYFLELNKNAAGKLEGVEDLKVKLIPNGVRMQFVFSHANTRLEWAREWAVR